MALDLRTQVLVALFPLISHCLEASVSNRSFWNFFLPQRFHLSTNLTETSNGKKKTYYMVPYIHLDWVDALMYCRSFEMHLASFNTQEDQMEFQKIYLQHSNLFEATDCASIGAIFKDGCGIRHDTKKCWYWMNTGLNIETLKWGPDEPNNRFPPENCACIKRHGNDLLLHDFPCNSLRQFVCESDEN